MTDKLLIAMITDLRSARIIINLLLKDNPHLREVDVSHAVKAKVLTELYKHSGDVTIQGVWLRGIGST